MIGAGFTAGISQSLLSLIDYATSITQRGKIEVYARDAKTMPAGWVIDESGETFTDPSRALKALVKGTAALSPLGGIGTKKMSSTSSRNRFSCFISPRITTAILNDIVNASRRSSVYNSVRTAASVY